MFRKVLIANRGEIALRVISACKELGVRTVAVYSEADRNSLHVRFADEAICIGPAKSSESYLNVPAVISAAEIADVDAIHPGYGLLSENANFAEVCRASNIKFIGPAPEVTRMMGEKSTARQTMKKAKVPILPGSDGVIASEGEALEWAKTVGYPVILKAVAGGGGRGIRLVDNFNELEHAYNAATSEATAAFGDGAVYMEKYLRPVKHIEMQLLADNFGNVVCLGERDCSIQRKNQKLIEESPAAVISVDTRKKMIAATVKAGTAVGYKGAGTIEYLLDKDGNFYFMEMNTRLQVEHPVTEMVTLIDLVKWQIRIASGMKLDFAQKDVEFMGHAIECRINAEDPYQNFKPSCGKIEMLHIPSGPWVRFDSAIYQGYTIPPFYDSMIGKLIVFAKTRDEAIRKMKAALCELIIEGVIHTASFQEEILSSEEFINSTYTTDYLGTIL